MPVKLRLQRHGKKRRPFYFIVAADARAPRDGKYIERLGSYNPNTKPATIEVDRDGALRWLQNGAQPTDTVRAILSYSGVMYRKHLLRGVRKGALTMEQADAKFAEWIEAKSAKIKNRVEMLDGEKNKAAAQKLADERAKRIEKFGDGTVAEETTEEAPADETATAEAETPATEETVEAPVAEETTETAAEKSEEVKED